MWKTKRRRCVRTKLMSIPSSLFPLHPTYGPNPLVLHPPPSSPLPNIANHSTTSHRSAVTANPSLGTQPEPIHLHTSAYPSLTPCHPPYTPDFTAAHLQNQHPPDIRTPRPIPPKPNISIQSPTFQQSHHPPGIRPCRKHPLHSLIPRHYRNVVRRISNKGRLRLS